MFFDKKKIDTEEKNSEPKMFVKIFLQKKVCWSTKFSEKKYFLKI